MCHHAIIVTSWDPKRIAEAHTEATRIFAEEGIGTLVSAIVPASTNGYGSFFVAPDGSKEGWPESDRGDVARALLVAWLDKQRYEDGSSPIDWAEIQYGDEDEDNRMLRSDAQPRRRARA